MPYVRLPGDELAAVLRQAGFSERNAALHVQMCRALSEGVIASRRRTAWTGTPTRFEDWSRALRTGASPRAGRTGGR